MSHSSETTEDEDCTGSVTLNFGQYLAGTGLRLRTSTELLESLFQDLPHIPTVSLPPGLRDVMSPIVARAFQDTGVRIILSAEDANRWKLVWRAIVLCPRLGKSHGSPTEFLTQRSKNWPSMEEIEDDWFVQISFCAATGIYGGLQILAWFARFDTGIEQLLW